MLAHAPSRLEILKPLAQEFGKRLRVVFLKASQLFVLSVLCIIAVAMMMHWAEWGNAQVRGKSTPPVAREHDDSQ